MQPTPMTRSTGWGKICREAMGRWALSGVPTGDCVRWVGDDWFHNGAFRQQNIPYIWEQEATRDNSAQWWTDHFDDYDVYMEAGSAGGPGGGGRGGPGGGWAQMLEPPTHRPRG